MPTDEQVRATLPAPTNYAARRTLIHLKSVHTRLLSASDDVARCPEIAAYAGTIRLMANAIETARAQIALDIHCAENGLALKEYA
jgi:hypothetical protein